MAAGTALVLAVAVPVHAQGKSNGKGNAHKSTPPSSTPLPAPGTAPGVDASPIAWLDDAGLLPPGVASTTMSMSRWSGADLNEVNVPIVEAAVGIAPRFQVGATVPHLVSSAGGAAAGGVGTSFLSTKIAILEGAAGVKLAAAPVLEILGAGAVQIGESRTRFGLPVSADFGGGPAHPFASAGFFSGGVWFVGGGVSVQATPKVGATMSLTSARASDSVAGVSRIRRELSGGASYAITRRAAVFGALGRTFATTDDSGAGTTVSGGVSVLFAVHR